MFMLALLLAACASATSLCDVGNKLSVASPSIRDAVIARLQHAGIPYEVGTDGAICYQPEARDEIASYLLAEDLKENPPNKIRLIGGSFANDVMAKLRDAKIDFTQSETDGYVFVLIAREEDVAEAMDIAEDVARSIGRKAPR
jgi:hypothetical protein